MSGLDQFKKKLAGLMTVQPAFDPSSLNDEVALKTKWTPAKAGGTNFGTHRLQEVSVDRVEFRARGIALLFPLLFMFVGLVSGVGLSIAGLKGDMSMLYIGLPFGGVFFLVGYFIMRTWLTPRVFDRRLGFYWRGHKAPQQFKQFKSDKEASWPLQSIHAVQLISEYCPNNSSSRDSNSCYSYELNLVFTDGKRVNVVDHGNHALIGEDARSLADFLAIPVWDAT